MISFECPLGFLLLKFLDNSCNSSSLPISFSVCYYLLPLLSSFHSWKYCINVLLLVMKLFFNSDSILFLSQVLLCTFFNTVTWVPVLYNRIINWQNIHINNNCQNIFSMAFQLFLISFCYSLVLYLSLGTSDQ